MLINRGVGDRASMTRVIGANARTLLIPWPLRLLPTSDEKCQPERPFAYQTEGFSVCPSKIIGILTDMLHRNRCEQVALAPGAECQSQRQQQIPARSTRCFVIKNGHGCGRLDERRFTFYEEAALARRQLLDWNSLPWCAALPNMSDLRFDGGSSSVGAGVTLGRW